MMKKKILILAISIFSFFIVGGVVAVCYYNHALNTSSMSAEASEEKVKIIVSKGMTTKDVIDLLYDSGLIDNKTVGYVYLKLNKGIIVQAGEYEVNRSMTLPEILEYISSGNVVDNSLSITFIEGKRLTTYVKQISEKFNYSEEEIFEKLSNKEYLDSLIEKYWFLTDDILNDKLYYALEGYLYPSTYQFEKDASIEDIIGKMLDTMGSVLKSYEEEITASNYSVHEILTLASVIQNEGKIRDFDNISSVFHNRLDNGMKLESCATSYYGAKKDFTAMGIANDELIYADNPYNTYIINKLPLGPISSPSKLAIGASLKPSETDFLFFLSDNEGTSYFFETYAEHQNKQRELVNLGKWAR